MSHCCNFSLIRKGDMLLGTHTATSCLSLFHPFCSPASRTASALPSTLSMSPKKQNIFYNSRFMPSPISTLVLAGWSVQPVHTCFDHATIYTTTLLVHPFLTVSTQYWVFTKYQYLYCKHMAIFQYSVSIPAFSTNHNFGFVRNFLHTFTLNSILPSIKLSISSSLLSAVTTKSFTYTASHNQCWLSAGKSSFLPDIMFKSVYSDAQDFNDL